MRLGQGKTPVKCSAKELTARASVSIDVATAKNFNSFSNLQIPDVNNGITAIATIG